MDEQARQNEIEKIRERKWELLKKMYAIAEKLDETERQMVIQYFSKIPGKEYIIKLLG